MGLDGYGDEDEDVSESYQMVKFRVGETMRGGNGGKQWKPVGTFCSNGEGMGRKKRMSRGYDVTAGRRFSFYQVTEPIRWNDETRLKYEGAIEYSPHLPHLPLPVTHGQ